MDVEGTSDVYCRAYFDSKEEVHETDTHFRCQNGKASFNYRLVYDRDFFKSNDIIGEAVIDLKDPILDSALSGRPLCVNKKYYTDYMKEKGMVFTYKDDNSFFIDIKGKNDKTGLITTTGKIRCQIDILPIV
jgi:C2 domain